MNRNGLIGLLFGVVAIGLATCMYLMSGGPSGRWPGQTMVKEKPPPVSQRGFFVMRQL